MKTIALSGFMGCGKSSIGKVLAGMLSGTFIDLDTQVEAISGRKITEIFAEDGEAAFRSLEKNCLTEILAAQAGKPSGKGITVLSLGGGTLTTPECAEMIHRNTFCIYLKAEIDTLLHNLEGNCEGRPMLTGQIKENSTNNGTASETVTGTASGTGRAETEVKEKEGPEISSETLRKRIVRLMSVRAPIYEKTAHITIEIDGLDFRQAAEKIASSISCYCC